MVGGNHLEVVGDVVAGGGVVGAADILGQTVHLLRVHVFGALEHQVFEQVREAGPSGRIVLGTDVIPDLHRDGRAGVVLDAEHLQAVGKRALVVLERRNGETVAGDGGRRETGGGEQGNETQTHVESSVREAPL